MDNDIKVFSDPRFGQIRTMTDGKGEPWFCGRDVAEALGYANPNDALVKHVDDEDRLVSQIAISGQRRQLVFINESGLYSLILSSKLDTARQFKRWVTSEVLPEIRKQGSYTAQDSRPFPISDDETIRRAFLILSRRAKTLTGEKQDLAHQLEAMKPKADYCDRCLQSSEYLTTTQVAKSIGMTGTELYGKLLSRRVLYLQSGQYMPYARYARAGLTGTRTALIEHSNGDVSTKQYLVWTEKGARFLRDMFRQMELPLFGK